MTRLVEARLVQGPGTDLGPTREFEEREAPFRAMADRRLRRQFVVEGLALTDAVVRLQSLGPGVTVTFTGWDMTADEIIRHGESELVLHRWDLVGNDEVSRQWLSRPELMGHAEKVLSRMALPAAESSADPSASRSDQLLQLWGRDPARRFVSV